MTTVDHTLLLGAGASFGYRRVITLPAEPHLVRMNPITYQYHVELQHPIDAFVQIRRRASTVPADVVVSVTSDVPATRTSVNPRRVAESRNARTCNGL